MSINDVGMLFSFIGGLGMFLYGMNIMADGLQKSAGGRMQKLMSFLTKNRLMAILVGAGITAIIQSSSATTVMVVGFVNAGMLELTQAVGVIMGANIGTTITAWIVSMSEWGSVMKPEFFAPLLLGIGAFLVLFTKSEKKKKIGEILVGFSILFIGLSFMSDAIKPYREAPVFAKAFAVLGKNPVLAILQEPWLLPSFKLFRFGRHTSDTGPQWCGELAVSRIYYAGPEYRNLRNRPSFQRGSRKKCKKGLLYPPSLQRNRSGGLRNYHVYPVQL